MFRLAGAQVATCDLLPSEIDYVPHFQGDCKHIQDQGWDLVIGHPPCTYLSAVGAGWLAQIGARKRAGTRIRVKSLSPTRHLNRAWFSPLSMRCLRPCTPPTFPPAAPPDTKAVWASLGVWHGQHEHERSRDVRAVP
eukprot:scaffold8412_cov142-Isochrysis_galbana.AAC.1